MDNNRISPKGREIVKKFKERYSLNSDRAAISCLVEKYEYMEKIYSEAIIQNQMLKNDLKIGKNLRKS